MLNVESRPISDRRVSRWLILWISALMVLWTGWVSWEAYGLLVDQDRSYFLEKLRWTSRHYAWLLGDASLVDEPLLVQAHVRRLAGEIDSRYVLWVDLHGKVLESVGALPDESWNKKLSLQAVSADDFLATEVPSEPPFLECVEPVWSGAKRRGILRWGVSTETLLKSRRRNLTRTLAIATWGILAGACLSLVLTRRTFR